MKKDLGLLVTKWLPLILLGIGFSSLFGIREVKYGDEVYIKNLEIKKYATRSGNVLVGRKEPSDRAAFVIIKDIENPELSKGKTIKYGDLVYLQASPAAVIGDSGEAYRIYGMMRALLGVVPIVQEDKICKFTILPGVDKEKKDGQPVYYGEKTWLQYHKLGSKSPIKYFRFNVSLSTYKKGVEVFISDDSKLMTKSQIRETKTLLLERTGKQVPVEKPAEDEKKITYYDVLGIDKNADSKTISKKCRQILLKIHPDKVELEEKEIAGEATKVINAANEVFSANKKIYDEWLKRGDRAPAGLNIIKITPEVYKFINEKTSQVP